MKLFLKDRITMIDLLPKEGNFLTLKALREAREDLGLTEEERDRLNVKVSDTGITWDPSKDVGKEYIFSNTILELVRGALLKLDESKKLTENHFSLYLLFVAEVV